MSPLGEGKPAAADESARTPTPLPAILRALKSIGETFAVTRSLDAVLQEIVESALGLTGGDGASIMLLSPDGRELVVAAATGPRASLILGERQPATASIAGAVVRHGNSSFIRGAVTGNEGLESHHPRDLGWGLSLPLRASRQILGVLNISTTVALGDLPPDEVDLLGILANHAAIMIEVGRLYEELSRKERRLELFVDRLLRAQEARELATHSSPSPQNEPHPRSAGPTATGHHVGRQSREPTADRLSARELEVLQLLVEGSTNKEIAARLSLSPDTVKNHVLRITQKLGAADRTQAAVTAIREGLVK